MVKVSMSRWYVIYSGWYLPNGDLHQRGLRTAGGKVFPAFAKLCFWHRLGVGKACRKSVLGLTGLEITICFTDLTAVLLFYFVAF
jgi:hypothetical protein